MALVTLENLSFTYPNSSQKSLSDISLAIENGAFVTLMGATGSGKSTLMKAALDLAGIDPGRRAETLSLAEFARLADSIQEA